MNRFAIRALIVISTFTSTCSLAFSSSAYPLIDRGISDSEILFGQCASFTGVADTLGKGMNLGLRAAFQEVNTQGGVFGRELRLVADDDAYEPDNTVECTSKMIVNNGVFALTGYVGTPTSKVAVPMAQELKIPLIGLFTGAKFLRVPVERYVINVRASYDDEAEALVEYLTRDKAACRISVFYQNDSFGLLGVMGIEQALARRNLSLASKGSFERNTLAIRTALAHIMVSPTDAVIILAPRDPAVAFILAAREAGLQVKLASMSFVGTDGFIAALGTLADGVIISQVVPSPLDETLPIAREYRAALDKTDPTGPPSYTSFEGYLTGRVILAALAAAGKDLSREKLIDAFHGMSTLSLDGLTFSFSESNHQGTNAVFLTVVKDGVAQPLQ